jgi:hypothetical protein
MGALLVATNRKKKREPSEVVGFVGVGLDNKDGESRITRAEHFILVGGSEETHGKMQDTAIKFNEALKDRKKRLKDTSVEEVIEIFRETRE